MRRKRAEKSGIEVDESRTRLKPGRKGKPPKVSTSALTTPVDDGTPQPDDPPQPEKKPNKGGLTKAYRSRAQINSMGFSAQRIRDEGYGLLRLGNFYKLMR